MGNQINKPTDYFNTVLHTGTNANQSITGVGFQPDLVWSKSRNNAQEHFVFDSVRGVYKWLATNDTKAETNTTTSLTSFDSDGFTVGSSSVANANSYTYASWNWLADNTSGSSNTDGSITSTVSANTTSGFSIVSYTGNLTSGATVGHGLSAVPKMIIIKNRDDASAEWNVYHSSLGATKGLKLNATDAAFTATNRWNDTEPTSSVFTLGNATDINNNAESLIAYCFAEKKGFSKFGSYTGNGSTDGTFVYTGFKPAFVIVKESSGVGNWLMKDNKRPTYNQNDQYLYANGSDSEFTNSVVGMDFLSNGFKCRGTAGDMNGSGNTIIYMAFAESPLVGTNNIPACAR